MNFVVSKQDFARVFKHPFEHAFSIANIKADFTKIRIYLFNPDAVATSKVVPSILYESPLFLSSAPSEPQSSMLSQSSTSSDPQSSASSDPQSSASSDFQSKMASSSTLSCNDSSALQSDDDCDATSLTVASPSPISSPLSFENTNSSACMNTSPRPGSLTPIVNPLVAVGLVPPDLADILVTPSKDAAVSNMGTKRTCITGARELTSNEYVEWSKEKQRKR